MKKPIWSSPNPRLELEGVADPRDPPVRLEGKQPHCHERYQRPLKDQNLPVWKMLVWLNYKP